MHPSSRPPLGGFSLGLGGPGLGWADPEMALAGLTPGPGVGPGVGLGRGLGWAGVFVFIVERYSLRSVNERIFKRILARKPEQKAAAAPVRKAYEARKWQRVKAAMALLRQAAPQA